MALRVLFTVVALVFVATLPAWSSPGERTQGVAGDVRVDDSALIRQLPDQVEFDDRMGIAEIAHLSRPLDTEGADPITRYRSGDVGYRASDRSLVVFLSAGAAVPGDAVIRVGRVTAGLDGIAACVRDCPTRLDVSGP